MEHAAAASHRKFAFGPFTLFPERQLLLSGTTALRIGGRALDILTALVERPGELLTKRELMARAWPTTVVDDSNLKVNMAGLRRVLGEGSGDPRYIATIVGRGYRFVAEVRSPKSLDSAKPVEPPPRQHNLPTGTGRIVGRESAIAGLQRDLGDARLVSLVGPGGIGKTTVALAAAHRKLGSFIDGVWLVDLAPLKDAALVPNAIATAVGMAAHSANVLAALCHFLRDRELLLVLDSCEHLIDAAAACAIRLLKEAPQVRILVTSREPLSLQGERVRRLPGLGAPSVAAAADSLQAMSFPAVELFVERAVDRLESFTLADADAPAVAEICRRLDGLALAIELAATRVDAFGIAEILSMLNARFRLLKGRRSGPDRHQTLRATIDWSFDLLSRLDQIILCRLSVFAGSFDLQSALAVVADDQLSHPAVTEGIANLVAKSLLAAEPGDIELQYRLLDTTRGYAMEKLDTQGGQQGVRRRHAQHALDVARFANADGDRLAREDWFERFGDHIDDLRLALDWALGPQGSAELAVRLTVAAVPFWERLSLFEECRLFVQRAMAHGDAADLTAHDEMVLCLASGGAQLFTRGPTPEVRQLFLRALALAEQLDRADLRLECLKRVSEYHLWEGDSKASLQVAASIRVLANAQGDLSVVADADAHAGSALHYLGDLHQARRHLEDFLGATARSDTGWETARFQFDQRLEARGSLAMVLWLLGFTDQALQTARQQRAEAEASNYAVPFCSSIVLTSTPLAIYTGDFADADAALSHVAGYAQEHGLPMWGVLTECMRVKWLLDSGGAVDLARYEDVLAQMRGGGLGIRYAPFLANLGHVRSLHGDVTGALASIDEAIRLSAGAGQVWGIPEMLRLKGTFIERGQQPGWREAAADCYAQSLEMARQQGALAWELRSAIRLAELWIGYGARQRAREMLEDVYRRFSEGFDAADLRRARELLAAI